MGEKYVTDYIVEKWAAEYAVKTAVKLLAKDYSLDELIEVLELSPEQIKMVEEMSGLQTA